MTVGQALPPGCAPIGTKTCKAAIADGTYPQVFNNDSVDGSFGLTSQIQLTQITPSGFPHLDGRAEQPAGHQFLLEVRAGPQRL